MTPHYWLGGCRSQSQTCFDRVVCSHARTKWMLAHSEIPNANNERQSFSLVGSRRTRSTVKDTFCSVITRERNWYGT